MYVCMYVNILLSFMKMYRYSCSPPVIHTYQLPPIDMQLLLILVTDIEILLFRLEELIDICFDLTERLQWAVLTHWNTIGIT